jgi:uncharacterized phage-associated protein
MASVFDVSAYILDKLGPITTMKLQKLVYYSQAWSLVWDDKPLFNEQIEAWANGPVIPNLYECHQSEFKITHLPKGDFNNLTPTERETIDEVLKFYGDKSSQWLSDLTHKEDPWVNARKGLANGERGSSTITHAAMAEYYGSL